VEELTPVAMSLGEVQRVLQTLLDEGVSVRDLVRIYEALSLRAAVTKDLDALVDAARQALGPAIVAPYVADGVVHVMSLEPQLEQRMLEDLRPTDQGTVIALDPELGQSVLHQLSGLLTEAENAGHRPVLVCSPQIRSALRRLLRPSLHQLPVLSYQELVGAATVRSVGVVSPDRMAVTA
jgi:flagellar biosynthesis protein FlhA